MIALVGHVSAALSIDSKSLPGVKLVGVLGNNDTDIPGLTSTFNKIHARTERRDF